MKLPRAAWAAVAKRKITEYLLCLEHREGREKAQWFIRYGFAAEDWRTLAEALRAQAREHDLLKIEESAFGQRYIVEGPLTTPDGRRPSVRTFWFIELGGRTPRLVTAYPVETGDDPQA